MNETIPRLPACRAMLGLLAAAVTSGYGTARAQDSSPPPVPDAPATARAAEPSSAESAKPSEVSAPLPTLPPRDPLPPTGIDEELDLIRPGIALKRKFDEIASKTDFRFGLANTLLYQQASGGPGDRSGAAGDLDLLGKWTAIGAGTKDTGLVALAAEYRYQIGGQTPSELGSEIGTLLGTTNGFGERPMVIKEFYWDQRLFEDHFRFAVGRIDPENLFGGHRLQSANFYFMNKAFSTNPTVAYSGPGMAAVAQIKPVSWFYTTAGITDANGKATVGNLKGFFEDHEYLIFGEVGVTPDIDGVGFGRYRLAVWHIDSRTEAGKPSDEGITVSFDQDIGEALTMFLRYGHAEGDVTGVTNSVQGGAGIKHVLGKDNLLGLAAAWSEPSSAGKRDEKVAEIFQRFQITETIQFTIGAQAIFDPSNAPDDDVLGVFSARLRFSF